MRVGNGRNMPRKPKTCRRKISVGKTAVFRSRPVTTGAAISNKTCGTTGSVSPGTAVLESAFTASIQKWNTEWKHRKPIRFLNGFLFPDFNKAAKNNSTLESGFPLALHQPKFINDEAFTNAKPRSFCIECG